MSGAAYSNFKAAWHIDRVKGLREGRPVIPVGLQLILSDLCNHDCHFCAYRASDGLSSEGFGVLKADGTINHNPSRMIPTEKAREIIRDAALLGIKSITFTGGGEPTVHPDHLDLIDYAMSFPLDCSLNTNGDALKAGWQEVLPRMKYVRFSVDAGTPDEYAAIRKVPPHRYWRVLKNLEELAELVKGAKLECVVGAGYVVTPENWVNLYQGVENLRATGAAYVRIASMQSTQGVAVYPGDSFYRAKQAIEECAELETDTFKVVNLFDQALGRVMKDPFCGFQHFVTYLGADLKLYRCCYTAYTKLGEIGDLKERTLFDWYTSGDADNRLRSFDARSCVTCPLADKNATIAAMVDPQPIHVNFV